MGVRVEHSPLAGVAVVDFPVFADDRGQFSRLYCRRTLAELGVTREVVQANHSETSRSGTVRGLHFQVPPKSETKVISCIRGRVFDVVVDLRKGSPTFMKWWSVELAGIGKRIIVPEGCAHGFQTLTDDVMMTYFHTEEYCPAYEQGIRYDEPRLEIPWPLPLSTLSDRDASLPYLADGFEGLQV